MPTFNAVAREILCRGGRRKMMGYPTVRMRRMRMSEQLRLMVREASLRSSDLIMPLFVSENISEKRPIESMPGCFQIPQSAIAREAKRIAETGILSVILFGIPARKDETASEAYNKEGIIQRSVKEIRDAGVDLVVVTDVCLCEYMSHGHCGLIRGKGDQATVDNDATLELVARTAVSHAAAGADIVAPSGMMDGAVAAIRKALDEEDFSMTAIMSYSAKYASCFYGPFRDAAESPPAFGDRKTYQMDVSNWREAMREISLDIEEGADIVMVKPALSYLDVICRAKERFDVPLAAYNVSGEYAMIKAAAEKGWLAEKTAVMEILTSIKRAGADLIISYSAVEAAQYLGQA
jgi:porphobilinogen synthase